MNTLHNKIYSESNHQVQLRETLLRQHRTMMSETRPHTFHFMKTLFLPVSLSGLALVAGVLLLNNNFSNTPADVLHLAQAAYAEELQDNNTVLHQVIHTTTQSGFGTSLDDISTQEVELETWDSANERVSILRDISGNIIEHTVEITDPQTHQKTHYMLASDAAALVDQEIDSAVLENTCVINLDNDDKNALTQEALEHIQTALTPEQLSTALQNLFTNNAVTDLGEANGMHGYQLDLEQFYFNTQTYHLQQYINLAVRDNTGSPHMEEYVVSESLPAGEYDESVFSTDGLVEWNNTLEQYLEEHTENVIGCDVNIEM